MPKIGCAGAIMCYLSKGRNVDNLPNNLSALVESRVREVEMFTPSDLMFVNADTLASLQVIQTESHPNFHMQGPNKSTSGAKESLSVFGLFNGLARTPQGKQRLRRLFLRPSTTISVITERLNTIQVLVRSVNTAALETIASGLSKIKDMRSVIIHLHKGINGARGASVHRGVWATLQAFTFYTVKVLEGIRELSMEDRVLSIADRVYSSRVKHVFG